MMRFTMRLAVICVALSPTAALTAETATPEAFAFELKPDKVHEECLRLEAGKGRRYEWSADAAVDFNIHYHRGDDVLFPVKQDASRGERGTFTAKTGEDYCWMWTAKDAVKVKGKIEGK